MTLLDEQGFYYAPFAILKTMLMANTRKEPTFEEVLEAAKEISKQPPYKRFFDFVVKNIKEVGDDTNVNLMLYHMQKFFQTGAITYKIRKSKVEFLKNIDLSIPANLLVVPHDEFLISIPKGAIELRGGHLLNIYVCQEDFDESVFASGSYQVEDNIAQVIKNNPGKIKRLIRCYGISWKEGDDDGMVNYYQFPIVEDMDVWEQFTNLMNSSKGNADIPMINEIFNLVLNFCAYLSCPNPDIQKALGVIRKPVKVGSKKWRVAQRDNLIRGYNYFDVGYIHDSRYRYDHIWNQENGVYVKRYRVRRHIRAQWYGSRAEGKPGTEQKLIMIEEHWKGDDMQDAFRPKFVKL